MKNFLYWLTVRSQSSWRKPKKNERSPTTITHLIVDLLKIAWRLWLKGGKISETKIRVVRFRGDYEYDELIDGVDLYLITNGYEVKIS